MIVSGSLPDGGHPGVRVSWQGYDLADHGLDPACPVAASDRGEQRTDDRFSAPVSFFVEVDTPLAGSAQTAQFGTGRVQFGGLEVDSDKEVAGAARLIDEHARHRVGAFV